MGDTFDYVICGSVLNIETKPFVRMSADLVCRGGTCGPVVAGRLSEDPDVKILILEAGQDSAELNNMHMAGAYVFATNF